MDTAKHKKLELGRCNASIEPLSRFLVETVASCFINMNVYRIISSLLLKRIH